MYDTHIKYISNLFFPGKSFRFEDFVASKVWAAWLERGRHVPQAADTGDRGFSTWVSRMHRRAGGNWWEPIQRTLGLVASESWVLQVLGLVGSGTEILMLLLLKDFPCCVWNCFDDPPLVTETYHSPPAGDTSQIRANYASDTLGWHCQRTICRHTCEGHFAIFSNSCAIVIWPLEKKIFIMILMIYMMYLYVTNPI